MLIEFEFRVSLISAEPRRCRPKRTPVHALGRLVSTASTSDADERVGHRPRVGEIGRGSHRADAAGDDQAERERGGRATSCRRLAARVERPRAPMRLAEAPVDEARLRGVERQPSRARRGPGREQRDVRHRDDGDEHASGRAAEAARGHREHHGEQPEPDERLELERLVPRPDARRSTTALTPSIAARLKAFEPTTTPTATACWFWTSAAIAEARLRRVGRERGEQAEERLGQAEPQPDVVEAPREHRRRDQHQRDGGDEEWDGGCGRHRLTPTSLPGTPGGTLAEEGSREPDPGALRTRPSTPSTASASSRPAKPDTPPAMPDPAVPARPLPRRTPRCSIASSSADPVLEDGEKRRAEPVGDAHRRGAYAMIGA